MRNLTAIVLLTGVILAFGWQARAGTPANAGTNRPVVADPAPTPVPRPPDVLRVFEKFATPAPARPNAPPRANGVPDDYKLAMLIRTSLIALNQANITGNYSVLRDLGAPAFQEANNPARLAELFANLRMRAVNLEPILVIDPKIAEPFINERGMLRIKGLFPTKPEQVNFELAFQPIGQQWRLFGISVTTSLAGPLAERQAAPGEIAR